MKKKWIVFGLLGAGAVGGLVLAVMHSDGGAGPSTAAIAAWEAASATLPVTGAEPPGEGPSYRFDPECPLRYERVIRSTVSGPGFDGFTTVVTKLLDAVGTADGVDLTFGPASMSFAGMGRVDPKHNVPGGKNTIRLVAQDGGRQLVATPERHPGWPANGPLPGLSVHFPRIPAGGGADWAFPGGSNVTIHAEVEPAGGLTIGGAPALMLSARWSEDEGEGARELAAALGAAIAGTIEHEMLAVVTGEGRLLWAYYSLGSDMALETKDGPMGEQTQLHSELRLVGACEGPVLPAQAEPPAG